MKNLRRLRISPELLTEFLVHPVPPGITSDAPEDLKIVGCQWTDTRTIELLVWSATFTDPADIADPEPLWELRFHRDATRS